MSALDRLPFPIASLYDRISAVDPSVELDRLLAFGEGVARFAAFVALADVAPALTAVDRKRLVGRLKKPGFGDLLALLTDACDALEARGEPFLPSLPGAVRGSFGQALSEMNEVRRDLRHHRISAGDATSSALRRLAPSRDAVKGWLDSTRQIVLGSVKRVFPLTTGTFRSSFCPSMGLRAEGAPLALVHARALPLEVPLLIDVGADRALPLAPFLLRMDLDLSWVDTLDPKAEVGLSYVNVRGGSAVSRSLVAPDDPETALRFDAWIADAARWNRTISVGLDEVSRRALVDLSSPPPPASGPPIAPPNYLSSSQIGRALQEALGPVRSNALRRRLGLVSQTGSVSAQMVNQLLQDLGLHAKTEQGWAPTGLGQARSTQTTVTGPERALISVTVWEPSIVNDLAAFASRRG